jgi:hypothetical protein
MASIVKIKRSSVQGKRPTTSDIQTGELALNTRDGKLFSSDGSIVFEVGANTTSINVGTLTVGNSSPFTFPTTDGANGQVLVTNGSGTLSFANVETTSSGGSNASDVDFEEYIYTASEGQQSFSGADDDGDVLSYVEEKLSVYLNGVILQSQTDYLASNGSSIFLTSGVANNDLLTVHTFNNASFREFQYTSANLQQSFSGTDDNNNFLRYSPDNIAVSLNGILLVRNVDYQATNTTSVFLTSGADENDILTIQSFKQLNGQQFFDGAILSNSSSTSTATQIVVDTFRTSDYRSAKYLVQITANEDNNKFQVGEVLLVHNGSSTFLTEYGNVNTNGNLGAIDSDINSNLVRLLVTPTDANTTIKVIRTTVVI